MILAAAIIISIISIIVPGAVFSSLFRIAGAGWLAGCWSPSGRRPALTKKAAQTEAGLESRP
jgi:hypothetical protein